MLERAKVAADVQYAQWASGLAAVPEKGNEAPRQRIALVMIEREAEQCFIRNEHLWRTWHSPAHYSIA
jgi:hypothetical protein